MSRRKFLTATAVLCTSLVVPMMLPSRAAAQANPTMTNVIPEGGSSAVDGKVQAVDPNARTITIVPSSGPALPLVAPASIALDNLEAGDKVSAHYTRSVASLLASPGTGERPGGTTTTVDQTARKPGQIGPQAAEIRGAVTKINGPRSFDIVDTTGGGVFTIQVTDPARVALVQQLKVGDNLTVSVGPLVLTSLAKCGPFGLICG
jgi:hypothetical protein